jgi:fusion and transport protein UGO1
LFDAVSQYLQPALQALFQSILLPSSSPLSPAPLPIALASHILTGVILSPLDLLRTHLIVQSASSHRIYSSNPLSSLPLLIHQKGGLRSTCFHPSLLIPTILDSAVRPYMTLSTPGFIYNSIGVTEDTYPITYAFAELLCSSASLLITIPIETVRRRLQIQSIPGAQDASSKSFHPCVEIRPQPYVGVVDCVWNILSEERGTPLKSSRRRRREHKEEGWFTSTGIPQLYRGFRLGVSANFFAFSLGILANAAQQANVDRWAEI